MQVTLHKPVRTVPSTRSSHATVTSEAFAATLPGTGYVRLPIVAGVSGLAKSTVWKWCADGRFPKPVKLSSRVSAWHVADLRAWLADPAGWQAANAEVAQ